MPLSIILVTTTHYSQVCALQMFIFTTYLYIFADISWMHSSLDFHVKRFFPVALQVVSLANGGSERSLANLMGFKYLLSFDGPALATGTWIRQFILEDMKDESVPKDLEFRGSSKKVLSLVLQIPSEVRCLGTCLTHSKTTCKRDQWAYRCDQSMSSFYETQPVDRHHSDQVALRRVSSATKETPLDPGWR